MVLLFILEKRRRNWIVIPELPSLLFSFYFFFPTSVLLSSLLLDFILHTKGFTWYLTILSFSNIEKIQWNHDCSKPPTHMHIHTVALICIYLILTLYFLITSQNLCFLSFFLVFWVLVDMHLWFVVFYICCDLFKNTCCLLVWFKCSLKCVVWWPCWGP